ncbi:MAG: TolC family protein [Geobacteraceae bacterium]|nr:TolC family protein [Geobacteraceae bacterium]NTW78950.1 TolC family protein [Geobacteraceae bacterium]
MKFLMMILVLLIPAVSVAETRLLTLEQAISIAMEKNSDIEKAREYANYVQGKYIEERAAALPQLSLNGTVAFSKDGSQEITGNTAQRQFGRTVDLSLSQPLYTWGKLNAAIRAAEIGLKTADQQLRLYRQAVYRDVVAAYRDIQLARELYRLALENRAQKQRHLDEAARKFSAGVATDYDVLAAEVAAENTVPEVIRAENSIRMAREQLRFLLAIGGEGVDAVGSLDAPAVDHTLVSYDEALKIAEKHRPELADLRLRIGIYDELVTIANADNKPRLDLKGGAGWHWTSLNDPAPALDANGAAWNVGLYLTFPFFDGLRTGGKVAQARSDLHTKQIEEAKLRDSIVLEVRQAEFSCRESAEILKALSGTVKQAERLVQMAEKGYEFGVKIRLEVDDAQLNLLQARSNRAKAQRDSHVAQVNYLWAMGVAGE